jgi:hypothetical protein
MNHVLFNAGRTRNTRSSDEPELARPSSSQFHPVVRLFGEGGDGSRAGMPGTERSREFVETHEANPFASYSEAALPPEHSLAILHQSPAFHQA